jgi:hypothetical protein
MLPSFFLSFFLAVLITEDASEDARFAANPYGACCRRCWFGVDL